MKKKSILSGFIAVCAACLFLAASYWQAPNTPTKPLMVTASVHYIAGNVNTAIEGYTKLTELTSVRYLINGAHTAVAFYTTHLGFIDGTIGITNGRARALVAALVGLISLVTGGLALARSAGRIGNGNGRTVAIVALVLGLLGMVLSVVHLGTSTGGFGTGSGRAGAIVALVLGLIGLNLGGLALARSRRSRSTD
jgi:hypothetical protein